MLVKGIEKKKLYAFSEMFWYVLYTCPRAEKKACHELVTKNFNVYLPMIKTLRVWKNRQKKLIKVPLFPGYIFIKTYEHELYNIIKLDQIAYCVSIGGKPVILKEKEIETIKYLLKVGNDISVSSKFIERDKVRVTRGALIGCEGVLLNRKGKTRFGIHLEGINQIVHINIHCSMIEKI